MKRHPSFVAALGMCFFASIAAAYAQVRADTGSIAIGGSVTGSTVIVGIPQEKVDELVRDAKRPLEGGFEADDEIKLGRLHDG
jgi:hypothetical protein